MALAPFAVPRRTLWVITSDPTSMPKPVSLEALSANVREEFTTLNILVQALNRELRDEILTMRQELKHIGHALRIAPLYDRNGPTNRKPERRPATGKRGTARA